MKKSKEKIIKEIVLDSVFQHPYKTAELIWDAAIEMAAEKAMAYIGSNDEPLVSKGSILQLKFKQ